MDNQIMYTRAVVLGGICLLIVLLITFWRSTVTVKEESEQVPEPWSAVQEREIQKLEALARTEGAKESWEYLKSAWGTTPIKAHYLSHVAGQLLYGELKAGGFSVCDQSFGFGCFHGLVSALVHETGEHGIAIAREACYNLSSSGAVTGCVHGLGHGILQWTGDIPSALVHCRALGGKDAPNCFDGVYMEYDMDAMDMFPPKPTSTIDTVWNFCQGTAEDAYPWCIRNQTFYVLAKRVLSATSTTAACGTLTGEAKDMCVSSVGILLADRVGMTDEKIIEACSYFTDSDDRSHCIVSSAKEVMFQRRDNIRAAELCRSLEESWLKKCQRMIQGYDTELPLMDMAPTSDESEMMEMEHGM